jgi:hypothetical protein
MSDAFQCICGAEIKVATDTEEVPCPNCGEVWWRAPASDRFQTIKPAGNRPIRGARPSSVTFDEADADEFYDHGLQTGLAQAGADGLCSSCANTGLDLAGWMGPTEQRPYPDACDCECGQRLDTARKVQLKVQELVDRSHEEGGGYWTAKYPAFNTLAGHLEDVERAVETDARLPDVLDLPNVGMPPGSLPYFDNLPDEMVTYATDDDLSVIVSREGKRPPTQMISNADVWKVVAPSGMVQIIKHRTAQAGYVECGATKRFAGRCTEPANHTGTHRDDATGRLW